MLGAQNETWSAKSKTRTDLGVHGGSLSETSTSSAECSCADHNPDHDGGWTADSLSSATGASYPWFPVETSILISTSTCAPDLRRINIYYFLSHADAPNIGRAAMGTALLHPTLKTLPPQSNPSSSRTAASASARVMNETNPDIPRRADVDMSEPGGGGG